MSNAQVSSVEAIEAFRADLLIFISNARAALEEVGSDLLRMRLWLENDQRRNWEGQLRVRQFALERTQSELFGARLSQFHETMVEKQLAHRRAQVAVAEAEEKLKRLKRWERNLDHDADPLLKQVEHMQNFLSGDLGRGVIQLDELIKSLQAYAGITSPAPKKTENNTA